VLLAVLYAIALAVAGVLAVVLYAFGAAVLGVCILVGGATLMGRDVVRRLRWRRRLGRLIRGEQ
jgi:cytochrome c biogenesis protein CcdA